MQTTADQRKSGQKEYGSAEERQEAQQSDEHKAVMRLVGVLAKALKAGYRFEERGSLEWRLVVGVARQYGWVGGRQRGSQGVEDARSAQHVLPRPQGEAARPIPSEAASTRGGHITDTGVPKKCESPEYIILYNGIDTPFPIGWGNGPRPVSSAALLRTRVLILLVALLTVVGLASPPSAWSSPL